MFDFVQVAACSSQGFRKGEGLKDQRLIVRCSKREVGVKEVGTWGWLDALKPHWPVGACFLGTRALWRQAWHANQEVLREALRSKALRGGRLGRAVRGFALKGLLKAKAEKK